MSLRARLVIGLLALATFGLVVAGAVTYAEQRSFLLDRVDQQARSALPSVSHSLDERGANVRGYGGDQSPPYTGPGHRAGGPEGGGGDRHGPKGKPQPAPVNLPPGTYGQRRDAAGNVLGSVVLSYGGQNRPAPDIPADLPLDRAVTVGSKGSSGLEYRVVAEGTDGQPGTTLAAVPLQEVDQTLDRLLRVEALVIAGVLLALATLSLLLVRVGLRPLDRIGETAGAIAGGDLSRRVSPATPSTEVGRLGVALNAMLERLEHAFREREASENQLRQFLADASHELRTPLASIRGYAEVFRMGAARSDADKDKAMRRIEEEATRMGILVEDLLTLARLDEVKDLEREEIDLTPLASDAVADARATDPGRSIELRADEPAVVFGTAHQLRQVFANLLGNALVHTPPGTRIEVSLQRANDRVVLTVRDHGRGLPTTDPDVLFGRFWRAEKGRERGVAGAGLGLAIVAGIVSGHGGEVTAENAEGGGARFVVQLPPGPKLMRQGLTKHPMLTTAANRRRGVLGRPHAPACGLPASLRLDFRRQARRASRG